MKSIEAYNRGLASYEGAIYLDTGHSSQAQGYFEAVQSYDGTIAISCFFNEVVDIPVDTSRLKIVAIDKEGWYLRTEGQIVIPSHDISTVHGRAMTTAVIRPTFFRAMRIPKRSLRYLGTKFALTNFLFEQWATSVPAPIRFSVEGRDIEIRPSKRYPECVRQLKATAGIEVTASIDVRSCSGVRYSLDEDATLMDNLVFALRLWSGNKLDWLYGEGLDDNFDSTVEMLHKNGVVGEFSNTISFLGWRVNLKELVQGWFSTDGKVVSVEMIREFIDYFVDCCATGPYFEIRALSAATLLDALSLKYATAFGEENVLSKGDFQADVLPNLEAVIGSKALDPEKKGQLKANLQGLYRTSFRRRLRLLNEELSLKMNPKLINRVKNARDKLVHEGRFTSKTKKQRWSDYACLLWTDFSTLCRLVGYCGELPPLV